MPKIQTFKLAALFVTASLALSACSISSERSEDSVTRDHVTYDHLETAQEQVELFDLQVVRLQEQIQLGGVSPQTLSTQSDLSDALRDVPADAIEQWMEEVGKIFEALPELRNAETTWLAEASQLVPSDEMNAVTEDLIGFFAISAYFEEGFGDWAVMLTVNLDTWKIIDWKVNENMRPGNRDYIPGGILCNRGEGCTHFRRVLPGELSATSVDANSFPVAIAKEDEGFRLQND